MSKKRKLDDISPTGARVMEKNGPIAQHMKVVAKNIMSQDTIIIISDDLNRKWVVPGQLLLFVSKRFSRTLRKKSVKQYVFDTPHQPETYGNFLLWMHTGRFEERGCLMDRFGSSDPNQNFIWKGEECSPGWTMLYTSDLRVCNVDSALSGWRFGFYIESPRFQNYAMERVFAAFSNGGPKFAFPPALFTKICGWGDPCQKPIEFFRDLIIRNWGDRSFLDHEDKAWTQVIREEHFTLAFAQGVAVPLEKRREQPMDITKYLVKEN